MENKNLIPQIVEMLGVEIGERFKIYEYIRDFRFEVDGLYVNECGKDRKANEFLSDVIINGIKKLPKKPVLTEDEKAILRNLPKNFKYVSRDEDKMLCLFDICPTKDGNEWFSKYSNFQEIPMFNHLFQFIKWEDKEPYNIEELLKD